MLSYALYDKALFSSIQAETEAACRSDEIDIIHLKEKCPQLQALYLETLRVTTLALSARKVVAPTFVGGKVLRSNSTILIPVRQLHINQSAFGPDADQFNTARFLENPKLHKSPCFKPFGGGANHCRGRFLAKVEVFAFIACIINRFDVEISPPVLKRTAFRSAQPFPMIDMLTPALGINGPVKGSDVYINLRLRG